MCVCDYALGILPPISTVSDPSKINCRKTHVLENNDTVLITLSCRTGLAFHSQLPIYKCRELYAWGSKVKRDEQENKGAKTPPSCVRQQRT